MTRRASGRGAAAPPPVPVPDIVLLAVVAAHRTGQPLHPQLVALGARFARCAVTAPVYLMLALPGPGVARGGILRVGAAGAGVEVELHLLPTVAIGALVCSLPTPLAVGRVDLDDATSVAGLVCTHHPAGALDVTDHVSWPAYLATRAPAPA
jgi:hypothetical protein